MARTRKDIGRGQNQQGVDVEWLRYNRSLTVMERIEKHRRAAESMLYLKNVAERIRGRRDDVDGKG